MKKFISVFLCTVVFTVNVIFTPYVTTVYASGIVTDIAKSISFDNVVKMVKSLYKVGYNVATKKNLQSKARKEKRKLRK